MAESFNKKEREKKRRKRKQDKAEQKRQRKLDDTKGPEFMYVDENGNLTPNPPDPAKRLKVKLENIDISTPKKGEKDQPDYTREGIVKFFNVEKGYGFIIEKGGDESYFVHIDNVAGEITTNDKVVFEVGNGPKGPIATNVKLI
jgi:cold shock CspA family protein